jgi:hypothetical protein
VDSVKNVIASKVSATFGGEHVGAAQTLIARESGFNPYAVNKTSGACGLSQSFPCSKMGCKLSDIGCQVEWFNNYVLNRYKNPTLALAHSNSTGWY